MKKLTVKDLMKLEEYAEKRAAFRARVIEHKKPRKLHIGPHMTLLFEDRLTIQYQVQEMLRIERVFEKAAIREELEAYNPLIPDGANWKATCLIEYDDPEVRRRELGKMRGVEDGIWVQVGGGEKLTAIANEDMPRSDADKTSAVHFLRFELPKKSIAELKAGATLRFGVDHAAYTYSVMASDATRAALIADLK